MRFLVVDFDDLPTIDLLESHVNFFAQRLHFTIAQAPQALGIDLFSSTVLAGGHFTENELPKLRRNSG